MKKTNHKITVALVGNPNSGKTTLFNNLTGLNQKVGNFPGVTVDKKIGNCQIIQSSSKDVINTEFIDLPGTYSLYPKSIEESITSKILCDPVHENKADVNVIIVDASNLKRSLNLATQVIDLKTPSILALNMMDLVEKDGIIIDVNKIQESLGVPVVEINARKKIGIDNLKQAILKYKDQKTPYDFVDINNINPLLFDEIRSKIDSNLSDFSCLQLVCNIDENELNIEQKQNLQTIIRNTKFISKRAQATETVRRYKSIDKILTSTVKCPESSKNKQLTNKFDKFLTHPV